jgi:pilus assembly protein FimV
MRISFPALCAIALLAVAVQPSMAVGFGSLVNATTLGQALDVTVPVRVDSTERITTDCFSAEVKVGDSPLASGALQLRLYPSPDSGVQWLRVYSSMRIAEPVINVTVSAGCPSRISRQFVVFVDPPSIASEVSVPTAVEPAGAAASEAGLNGSAVSAVFLAAAAGSDASARADESRAPARLAASRSQLRKTRPPVAGRVSTDTQVSRASARKSPRVRPSATARTRQSASLLQLQRGTALAAAPAMAAVASGPTAADMAAAAAMVTAAAAAASEAERTSQVQREQIAELQRRLEQSRLDIQVSNAAAAKLQARLEAAQASRYSLPWLLALTLAVAVLLFGICVLLDRRSLARRARQPSWSYERPQTRPTPSTLESVPSATMVSSRSNAQLAQDDTREALTSTGPLPFNRAATKAVAAPANVIPLSPIVQPPLTEAGIVSGARMHADPARSALPVTADALIDLEQQAEFFVALGQEDTAVELLDGFSRGAGGACPMPYLMLLAIHRRRGDREAYAAVRARYEKRFNRSSPAWDGQSDVTTSIADHAEEMRRIESVWSDSPAAMRLIESLLVHGGTLTKAFDLHCLGELRFLYLLARDHSETNAPPAEPVDMLLPMIPLATAMPVGIAVDLELDFLAPEFPERSSKQAQSF